MNITFKKKSNNKHFYTHEAFFENICIGDTDYEYEENEKHLIYLNKNALSLISEYKLDDIFNNSISTLVLKIDKKEYLNLNWTSKESEIWFKNDGSCYLSFYPDPFNWDKPLSILLFFNLLEKKLTENNEISINNDYEYSLDNEGLVELTCKLNLNKSIHYEYGNILSIINNLTGLIIQEHEEVNTSDSLISLFSFPQEIQTSCEQYLIYFSQFMKDLGVNVTSNIKIEAKNTLFTVTPEDKNQALTQIRDALNIFLELAEIENIETYSKNYHDIGVQQLVSNIYHLKSQLMLSNSIIQMKEATIESLKFSNYQKTVLLESNSKNNSNEEKTLSGLVTINELKGKGFKINLPEIFRRIKRRLK